MNRVIFHVDVDAFYASVEQRDNPDLIGKPVIVGALPGHRGVVSACSYEARRYGIGSAMPISEAYRRCPEGSFLPVRMSRYIEVSRSIMSVLKGYSPEFHQISIDEACLDLSGTERLYGPPQQLARRIKDEIRDREKLTISIGIAPNNYLAKLASEACKPDGILPVEKGKETEFLDTLKLKDLWGVGKKTLSRLFELNITTIPLLRSFSEDILKSMMGGAAGHFLYSVVRGLDSGIRPEKTKSRSISSEVTFETDKKDAEGLKRMLLELAQQVMERLIDEDLRSHTLFIKVRFHDFTTVNAQKTEKHWISSSEEMYKIALDLFKKKWKNHTPVRLIGLGVSGVVGCDTEHQLELFEDRDCKKKKVEETVTRLRKKTGIKLTRASLLPARKESDSEPAE